MNNQHLPFHFGCGIWRNKDWVGSLYENPFPDSYLRQYSTVFNGVEGNSTFYGLPSQKSIQIWRLETPAEFRFCFKLPKVITHKKVLKNTGLDMEQFICRLSPLKWKLGPICIQLPPSFHPKMMPIMDEFLRGLPSGFDYAIEVRHPAFYTTDSSDSLFKILEKYHISRVLLLPISNLIDLKVPAWWFTSGPFPIIRFVGHPVIESNFKSLKMLTNLILWLIDRGFEPFEFFHTPDDYQSPQLASTHYEMIADRIPLPPLADFPGRSREQMELF